MKTESPTKVMARTSTILNPYLTGEPTRWPMPEQLAKAETGVSLETPMEASKVKPQSESARPRPAYNDDATYRPGAFSGLFKEPK